MDWVIDGIALLGLTGIAGIAIFGGILCVAMPAALLAALVDGARGAQRSAPAREPATSGAAAARVSHAASS